MSIKLHKSTSNARILATNLYKSLTNYSSLDIALLEENIRIAVKGYTKALSKKTSQEEKWFGALDIFCDDHYKNFVDDFEFVKKFIEDWTKLKNGDERSARCQFGRIFYQVIAKDPDTIFEYRKLPGKNFEYCRIA
jgi:hypothetical protein